MELRDYQKNGAQQIVELLSTLKIAVLVWQPRCGKTLAALEGAKLYGAQDVLFVTKKKAISNIESDYNNLGYAYNLTVTNYESLHNFVDKKFDLVIADEVHTCAGFPKPAVRTTHLKEIAKGKPVILISATITPESYSQIYHEFYISSFSPFAEYKNFYAWFKDFGYPKKRYVFNRELNDYSHSKEEKIKEVVGKYMITMTQEQAGFNQEIKEEVIRIRMQDSTYWLAKKLIAKKIHIGKDGSELVADTEVKLRQKLHQIYSGTVKCEDGTTQIFDISKATFIKQHFAGKKIAIYYQYIGEGEMLRRAFGSAITESPEVFNESDNRVFISQIQSGREGVNIATADCMIMFNIGYSSVSYQQARERIQDKNRKKEALLYWIFADEGIEHNIYKVVSNKKDYSMRWFLKDFGIKKQPNVITKEPAAIAH
ncbi:DEAD/DEAH box helicase [Niabella aurantiaca]|uniref:DEAD/DEAH box helicase n=1 Tax=Niabella aurantiaca TaxID=379900 RepID=UPI00036E1DEF|nr:DEAD/DEAH box helicase [Niabella aurantiaca]